jgi:hypothetical protein
MGGLMAQQDLGEITGTLCHLQALVAADAPHRFRLMPPAVEDALLLHLAMGVEATRRALHAAHGPAHRYYLAHAREELAAATALIQEWAEPL